LSSASEQVSEQDSEQVNTSKERIQEVLYYCETARTRGEIQNFIKISTVFSWFPNTALYRIEGSCNFTYE